MDERFLSLRKLPRKTSFRRLKIEALVFHSCQFVCIRGYSWFSEFSRKRAQERRKRKTSYAKALFSDSLDFEQAVLGEAKRGVAEDAEGDGEGEKKDWRFKISGVKF